MAESHIPLPPTTPAFLCAKCGAVALSPTEICEVQGKVTKGDWCGSRSIASPKGCVSSIHNERFSCNKCGRVSINPELLCEPQRMAPPQ